MIDHCSTTSNWTLSPPIHLPRRCPTFAFHLLSSPATSLSYLPGTYYLLCHFTLGPSRINDLLSYERWGK